MKYTDPKRTIVAIVLLPILVAGFSTYLAYREPGVALVDFERRYESAFISGFHDHERSDGRGLRWTARDAFISLKNLPAGSHVRIEARVKGLRPRGIPLPRIRFTANGATVFETLCDPGLVTYRFSVPLSWKKPSSRYPPRDLGPYRPRSQGRQGSGNPGLLGASGAARRNGNRHPTGALDDPCRFSGASAIKCCYAVFEC